MLNEDYKDMLQALADEKVRFLLVGAYALAAHGYLRATMDIETLGLCPHHRMRKQFYAPYSILALRCMISLWKISRSMEPFSRSGLPLRKSWSFIP